MCKELKELIEFATEEGRKEGWKEGWIEGWKEGWKEGEGEVRKDAAISLVKMGMLMEEI